VRLITLSYVASIDVTHVSTLSHKWQHFLKYIIEHGTRVSIFSTFKLFLILRRIQQYITVNVNMSACTVPVTSQISMKIEYSPQLFEKYSNIKLYAKSIQWEASCSTRTDRWTGEQRDRHDEPKSRSSQFCQRAQKKSRIGNKEILNFLSHDIFSILNLHYLSWLL